MSCIQCGSCECVLYGLSEEECCGASLGPCCYLYTCGMCDYEHLKEYGPCDFHKELIKEGKE